MADAARRLSRLIRLGAAGLALSCSVPRDEPRQITLSDSPLFATALLSDRLETLDDSLGLSDASDLVAIPGGYLVVDTGNDRLVRFDRSLRARQAISRSGSGPGELEVPIWARPAGGEVGVVELSNGRISFFDWAGDFVRTLTLPVPPAQAAFDRDGVAYVASGTDEDYLTRVAPDGFSRPFGLRPTPRGDRPSPVGRNGVAVTRGGRVLVMDDEAGHLVAYHRDGSTVDRVALPEALVTPVREARSALAADLAARGLRVVGHGLTKSTATQPDGRVLILISGDGYFGLLVDPDSMTGRLLAVPSREGVWKRLLHANAAVIEGDTITALHPSGLSRFLLRTREP